jgi:hypothetical protein
MARISLMSKIVMEACIIACCDKPATTPALFSDVEAEGLGSTDGPSGEGADKEYQDGYRQGNQQNDGRIETNPQEQDETGRQNYKRG